MLAVTAAVRTCITCFVTTELYLRRKRRSPTTRTACKPRHIPLRQSRPYQPRACFIFRLSLPVDSPMASSHTFQIDPPISTGKTIERKLIEYQDNTRYDIRHVVLITGSFCLHPRCSCQCARWLFFRLGSCWGCIFILHIFLVLVINSGSLVFFIWWPKHPLCRGFTLTRIASHQKCWSVGYVGVGGTNRLTHHPTHRENYLLSTAHTHLPTNPPSHHARFMRRCASLYNGSDP